MYAYGSMCANEVMLFNCDHGWANPGSEFVVANTYANEKVWANSQGFSLALNSQGFSQKVGQYLTLCPLAATFVICW